MRVMVIYHLHYILSSSGMILFFNQCESSIPGFYRTVPVIHSVYLSVVFLQQNLGLSPLGVWNLQNMLVWTAQTLNSVA
jgi:hypothetical protein